MLVGALMLGVEWIVVAMMVPPHVLHVGGAGVMHVGGVGAWHVGGGGRET